MNGIIFCLFVISAILFVGMFHYFAKHNRPGVYPPKRVLKQRVMVLGSGGAITAVLGFLCLIITK